MDKNRNKTLYKYVSLPLILLSFRFMRRVAYREFSHLVHGCIGKNRVPLPACAYHAIRSTFKPNDNDECFVGFQDDEMEI